MLFKFVKVCTRRVKSNVSTSGGRQSLFTMKRATFVYKYNLGVPTTISHAEPFNFLQTRAGQLPVLVQELGEDRDQEMDGRGTFTSYYT